MNRGFGLPIGDSAAMQEVYRLIVRVCCSPTPVIISGETGTGKELVARSIHFLGNRKSEPFIPVDCTGLAPTLVEPELFGYVRGAFTGATQSKRGVIQAANGGTVFLDEIGDLPIETQGKLLCVLQEAEVRPVGATSSVRVDVRFIAATNRDLGREVQQGRFRQDMFYRLNVISIGLPLFRERKSDIPLIVSHFLDRFAPNRQPKPVFSDDAVAWLLAYNWPGNVRELGNVIARALVLDSDPVLHLSDLPTDLQNPAMPNFPIDEEDLTLADLAASSAALWKKPVATGLRPRGSSGSAKPRSIASSKNTSGSARVRSRQKDRRIGAEW